MAVSNNGWLRDPPLQQVTAGGRTTRLVVGAAGDLLEWFAQQFHARVEPLVTFYGYRSTELNDISGGIKTSNHISGTAMDLNGYKHPYESTSANKFGNYKSGFTTEQTAEIRKIQAETGGVVKWGMDFAYGFRDAMHFEIKGDLQTVSNTFDRISNPVPVPPPVVVPPKPLTPVSKEFKEMKIVQFSNNYALVGGGYAYVIPNSEHLAVARQVWGEPIVLSTRYAWDLAVAMSYVGTGSEDR